MKQVCEYCGGTGSILVDFEHRQWITCEACKSGLSPAAIAIEKSIVQGIGDLRTLTVEERSEVFGSLTSFIIGHALMDMGVTRSDAVQKAREIIDQICEYALKYSPVRRPAV